MIQINMPYYLKWEVWFYGLFLIQRTQKMNQEGKGMRLNMQSKVLHNYTIGCNVTKCCSITQAVWGAA